NADVEQDTEIGQAAQCFETRTLIGISRRGHGGFLPRIKLSSIHLLRCSVCHDESGCQMKRSGELCAKAKTQQAEQGVRLIAVSTRFAIVTRTYASGPTHMPNQPVSTCSPAHAAIMIANSPSTINWKVCIRSVRIDIERPAMCKNSKFAH